MACLNTPFYYAASIMANPATLHDTGARHNGGHERIAVQRSRNPRQQAVAPRTKRAFTGRPSQAFLDMVRDAIDVTAVDCTGSSLFKQNRIALA